MAAVEMVSTVNKPPIHGCHSSFRDEHCTAPYSPRLGLSLHGVCDASGTDGATWAVQHDV